MRVYSLGGGFNALNQNANTKLKRTEIFFLFFFLFLLSNLSNEPARHEARRGEQSLINLTLNLKEKPGHEKESKSKLETETWNGIEPLLCKFMSPVEVTFFWVCCCTFRGHFFELWSKVKSEKKNNHAKSLIQLWVGRESISRGRSKNGQTVEWF